jgi:hypothetical protein
VKIEHSGFAAIKVHLPGFDGKFPGTVETNIDSWASQNNSLLGFESPIGQPSIDRGKRT